MVKLYVRRIHCNQIGRNLIMSELNNLVWEHKYRPKVIEDTILPEVTKKMLREIITSGNIPNFLFHGTSGTGKTTVAKAIASELGADFLFINASLDGNIDTLRTTITQFVSTVSFTDSKKIVLLDEADFLNCFSGEQEIYVMVDKKIQLSKLSELKDKDFKTISYNFENKSIEITDATAYVSGEKELFEVEFEDGTKMICTKDHPFFTENGELLDISAESLFMLNKDEIVSLVNKQKQNESIYLLNNQ